MFGGARTNGDHGRGTSHLAMTTLLAIALLLGASAFEQRQAVATQYPGPEQYMEAIAAFAAQDRATPTAPCQIPFVGSSSIRFWATLHADMAPVAVLNRGFGGARIADVNFCFDQVVAPYRPRAIVFYAGENDIFEGLPPERVLHEFAVFMQRKDRALGDIPAYFISLKPSKTRRPKHIFVEDGLHMTPEGCALWTSVVAPEVAAGPACRTS